MSGFTLPSEVGPQLEKSAMLLGRKLGRCTAPGVMVTSRGWARASTDRRTPPTLSGMDPPGKQGAQGIREEAKPWHTGCAPVSSDAKKTASVKDQTMFLCCKMGPVWSTRVTRRRMYTKNMFFDKVPGP